MYVGWEFVGGEEEGGEEGGGGEGVVSDDETKSEPVEQIQAKAVERAGNNRATDITERKA